MERRTRFWSVTRLLIAGTLAMIIAIGCQIGVVPGTGEEDITTLRLVVGSAAAARFIQVTEYPVTSLQIEVTGPEGEVIQTILWVPEDGRQVYEIPVEQLGEHEVTVAHRSSTQDGRVEAVESETFNITEMVITEVRIVPGAVGYILIDAEQRAADLKAREVLPEILEEYQPASYVATRLSSRLPRGTSIVEDAPTTSIRKAAPLLLEEDSYFYFVDLQPGAYYEHPVNYIIVGSSGTTKVVKAQWWPRINEKVPEPIITMTPKLTNVLERDIVLERPALKLIEFQIRPGLLQLITKEAFISVQGLTTSESLYPDSVTTYQNVYNFFDVYRSSFSTIVGLTDVNADNILSQIDTLAAGGYDIITIYIIAHGGTNYVRLGGVVVTAGQFAAKMAAYPNIQFNFLNGACHSGSFVDDLQAVNNVRVVETACALAESAWPDKDQLGAYADVNNLDTGSEWTSSWLEAAQVITSDPALWSIMTNRANTYKVPATSVLLSESGYLGSGTNRGLPTTLYNYDLTYVAGWSTPQHYNSWEVIN